MVKKSQFEFSKLQRSLSFLKEKLSKEQSTLDFLVNEFGENRVALVSESIAEDIQQYINLIDLIELLMINHNSKDEKV